MTDIRQKAQGLVDKINMLNSKINSLPPSDRKKLESIQSDVNKSLMEMKQGISDAKYSSK